LKVRFVPTGEKVKSLLPKITSEVRRQMEISTLLESMPEGVLIVDAEGQLLEVNSSAENFFGRKREELRGANMRDLERLVTLTQQAETLRFPNYALTRALNGEMVRNERRTFRMSGNSDVIEALVSASPIRDDGAIIGAVVIIRDVSELTALQRQLSDTERHHAIGQMAAGLAHDFNNVLDTIEKAATVLELKSEAPVDQRRSYLQMIHHAVARGAEIIERLRQYLRDRSTDLRPVDLEKLVRDTVDLTQPMLHEAQNIRLQTAIRPVPRVRGNVADLRRVFTNLIMNAIEAMPRGGELWVGLEEHNGSVRAQVADTGVGIPLEQQKKIFYPYFSTKAKGTGLGLSGAQRIVLSYGGNIRVQSEPGKGTRFIVEIPKIEESGHQQASNNHHHEEPVEERRVA
jgi:PAS domain S-box-containing protein